MNRYENCNMHAKRLHNGDGFAHETCYKKYFQEYTSWCLYWYWVILRIKNNFKGSIMQKRQWQFVFSFRFCVMFYINSYLCQTWHDRVSQTVISSNKVFARRISVYRISIQASLIPKPLEPIASTNVGVQVLLNATTSCRPGAGYYHH
jgi:hypothetical protein